MGDAKARIWILDVDSKRKRLLTPAPINYVPVWSTEGTRIAFTKYGRGYVNIFWKHADSDEPPEPLVVDRDVRKYPAWWSPGEDVLVYNTLGSDGAGDIWRLSGNKSSPLVSTRSSERLARLSRDGRCLAYVSDESGSDEVYARPFPGPGSPNPVSSGGGTDPVWSPARDELFYSSGTAMIAVSVAPDARCKPGASHELFEGPYVTGGLAAATYDVSPDGKRFLMVRRAAEAPPANELKVIVNWIEELKEKLQK